VVNRTDWRRLRLGRVNSLVERGWTWQQVGTKLQLISPRGHAWELRMNVSGCFLRLVEKPNRNPQKTHN
jgi:hypothetical protein